MGLMTDIFKLGGRKISSLCGLCYFSYNAEADLRMFEAALSQYDLEKAYW